MILVSGCLVGQACRYDGHAKLSQEVIRFLIDQTYITFCPEVMGGLSIPREPAEIQAGLHQVLSQNGTDVTDAFIKGAERTVSLARRTGCTLVISKEGSPSCGVHRVYNGSFKGVSIVGSGMTTVKLLEAGFCVISEEEISNG
jgi:uncharacterized protein YbbK (DUF523 family)